MIPLSVPHIQGNELKYVTECIQTGWVSTAGSYVNRFEEDIAKYVGAKHAVACVNGTSALHISLLLTEVGFADEVIVPTLTFIAPINAVKYVGANPVFMDCDDWLNIDIEKLTHFIEKECEFDGRHLINKKTKAKIKAVIPVHIFGHPVSMKPLLELASKYNLKIIEDATESLGSSIHSQKTGTLGDLGCFSFNGNKIITTGGGGMIVTNNNQFAQKARYLTTQAKDDAYLFVHDEIGYNYRLNNVAAAIGCAQMEQLDEFIKIKRNNFNLYQEFFKNREDFKLICEPQNTFSNYWYYTLLINPKKMGVNAVGLFKKLKEKGIETRPLWKLNHLQKPYQNNQAFKIEKALDYYEKALSLPCSIGLNPELIPEICKTIIS